MMKRFIVTAISSLLALPAFAYVRETDVSDNNVPVAWVKNRTVVMQLSLGGTRTLRDGFTSFDDSAADALATWNAHLVHLHFSWVKNSPVTAMEGDDEMSALFSSTFFGQSFGKNTLAVTTLSYRNGNIEETDTSFNTAIQWDSYRGPLTPPVYDFHRVSMHEFGHTLGLDHPDQAKPKQNVVAIMNSIVSNLDTLAQDDINGVNAIYGTGPNYLSASGGPILENLSTRGFTFTGDNVLIGGFIIQGSQPAQIILRGIAYSLTGAGVAGALNDPVIELHDANQNIIATNDDWFTSADATTIASYHLDPSNSIESALIVTLNPGGYSVIVRSFSDSQQAPTSGIALVELFDLTGNANSRAGNVSTRGFVGNGDQVLIGGFILGSGAAKPLVLRALGPSLTQQGVSGVLSDPSLELHDGNGNLIEANDDWQQSPDAGKVAAVNLAPGNPKEAAIAPSLGPGAYSVIVRGVGGATGTGLVEIFDISPSP